MNLNITNQDKGIARRVFAVLGLTVFLNIFLFHSIGSGAFSLFSLGLGVFLTVIFFPQYRIKNRVKVFMGFAILFLVYSFLFIYRLSFISALLNVLLTLATLSYLTYLFARGQESARCLMELILVPLYLLCDYLLSGLAFLVSLFDTDSDLWKVFSDGKSKNYRLLVHWLLGLVIGLPIVLVLISLLRGADPIFSSYAAKLTGWIGNIFQGEMWKQLPDRVFFSVIVLGIFSPFIFFSGRKNFRSPLRILNNFPLVSIATVVVFMVVLTMGSFVLIQWPYVFANVPFETDLSQFGVATYSEYVRKGFGELLFVSLFIYSIIWFGLISLRTGKNSGKSILSILQNVLLAEFVIFLISIGRRIWLYQSYHGWSLGRIYGGVVLFWIFGITVSLLLRHFTKRRWVLYEVLFTAVLILSACAFNAENFIVRTHPPTVNKNIDYVYLSRFYPQGYEGWLQAYQYARNILTDEKKHSLYFYDEEARREVAYAGIITRMLTKNYDDLVKEYGNKEKRMEYFKSVLLLQRDETEKFRNGYTTERIQIINSQIDTDLARLAANGSDEFVPHYYIISWPRILSFNKEYLYRFYYIYSPTDGNIHESGKKNLTFLDRFFLYNFSKHRAYLRMTEDIPYTELFKLQIRFFDLSLRISAQNSNEKSYSSDISFDGPFLQPL